MMISIVGILGRKRTGKTTLARYARDRYGATVVSFADPLRDMVDVLIKGIDEADLGPYAWCERKLVVDIGKPGSPEYVPYAKDLLLSQDGKSGMIMVRGSLPVRGYHGLQPLIRVRTLLQLLGTDVVRNHIDQYLFASMLVTRVVAMAKADRTATLFVVDDMRSLAEVTFIRDVAGTFWRNSAGGSSAGFVVKAANTTTAASSPPDGHVSEEGVDAIDPSMLDESISFPGGETMYEEFDKAFGRLAAGSPILRECSAVAATRHAVVSAEEVSYIMGDL